MGRGRSTDDPGWIRALVAALNAPAPRTPALPLIRAVREVDEWKRHFDVASDRLDELLAAAGDDHTRRTARRWLASIDDATAHVELLDTLADQCELLAGRTKRVRNGIAHGTPPSAEVTESVMEYSRWRVFRALHYAMQAATTGRLMLDVLDEEIQSRHGELAALKVGVSMRQQWAAAR